MDPAAIALILGLVLVIATVIVTFEDLSTERRMAARARAAIRRIGEDVRR